MVSKSSSTCAVMTHQQQRPLGATAVYQLLLLAAGYADSQLLTCTCLLATEHSISALHVPTHTSVITPPLPPPSAVLGSFFTHPWPSWSSAQWKPAPCPDSYRSADAAAPRSKMLPANTPRRAVSSATEGVGCASNPCNTCTTRNHASPCQNAQHASNVVGRLEC